MVLCDTMYYSKHNTKSSVPRSSSAQKAHFISQCDWYPSSIWTLRTCSQEWVTYPCEVFGHSHRASSHPCCTRCHTRWCWEAAATHRGVSQAAGTHTSSQRIIVAKVSEVRLDQDHGQTQWSKVHSESCWPGLFSQWRKLSVFSASNLMN